jgi:hypothetical protein
MLEIISHDPDRDIVASADALIGLGVTAAGQGIETPAPRPPYS